MGMRLVSSLIEKVIGILQTKVISHGDGEDQHQRQREPQCPTNRNQSSPLPRQRAAIPAMGSGPSIPLGQLTTTSPSW
jgi:hypothetical protein